MDAKVGDLVVTPRRGKAVEINALWYNALRLRRSGPARNFGMRTLSNATGLADHVRESFSARFWNEVLALFDVVDGEQGDDDAIRPNQLFAISLLTRARSAALAIRRRRGARSATHAIRAALARAGHPTINHTISAICAREICRITRGPSGHG
jgi:glycogen debranching enzyme